MGKKGKNLSNYQKKIGYNNSEIKWFDVNIGIREILNFIVNFW